MSESRAPALSAFIQSLATSPFFRPQVVHRETIPGRDGAYGSPEFPLPTCLQKLIQSRGIERLYAHQCMGIDHIRAGRHTVVATPTASGKSLIYTLPVLESVIKDPESRALYLSPLKALARDQLETIRNLGGGLEETELTAAVYDGDTSPYRRRKLREGPPHILLSNPEMLHLSLLPHHHVWADFLRSLKYVIVDEVHTYRGVMGSHMAWVFRRLQRICAHYGANPVFVFCSATIGNPAELCRHLTGLPVHCVQESTAPAGNRDFFFLNPLDGAARSAVTLLLSALPKGIRTIVYTQSRKMTELIAMWCAEKLGPLSKKVSAYRAGFLPEERREIEGKLARGELLAVISTSALELGIDIGSLDLCLLVGYPGSVMTTWQRGGRVGRTRRDSAVVLLGHEDALDQYFMNNPSEFFRLAPENAVVNPENTVIAGRQILCAAADLPLKETEELVSLGDSQRHIQKLEQSGRLLRSADGSELFSSRKSPQRDVDLRGAGRRLTIFETASRQPIGEIDFFRSLTETHPGAVYLHRGQTYVIDDLSLESGSVFARRERVSWYTRARQEKQTDILERYATRTVHGARISWGRLRVTAEVTGYEKRLVKGQRIVSVIPLDLPPLTFETEGLWIEIPEEVRKKIEQNYMHFMGGIHALEHAAIGILPLLVLTDRNDLGGISIPVHPQLSRAAVFVYDGIPGGVGLSRQAYAAAEQLLERTRHVVLTCPCELGCPACVHSPKCGSGNRPIDKNSAAALINLLLDSRTRPPDSRYTPLPKPPSEQEDLLSESLETGPVTDHGIHHAYPEPELESPAETPFSPPTVVSNGKRFAVLDLETCRSAQEVGGWQNAHLMGISCVVLYDSQKDDFLEFRTEDIPSLVGTLVEFDQVIGFNILRFDYSVLRGASRFDFHSLPTLDLLQEIKRRLGYRLSLDHLARHTLGVKKSGNGLQALKWWKQGQIDRILEYCRKDVLITRDLFLHGREKGFLLFQNKAAKLVRIPVGWK